MLYEIWVDEETFTDLILFNGGERRLCRWSECIKSKETGNLLKYGTVAETNP
jgi:hypothetical protein